MIFISSPLPPTPPFVYLVLGMSSQLGKEVIKSCYTFIMSSVRPVGFADTDCM